MKTQKSINIIDTVAFCVHHADIIYSMPDIQMAVAVVFVTHIHMH